MKRYMNPSTEVQTMKSAYMMQSTSTQTAGGGDQGGAQAPVRKPF